MKKILFLALLIVALVSVAFAQTGGISYPPSDATYDATSWNGSLLAPTQNSIRDKIETLQPYSSTLATFAALTATPAGSLIVASGGTWAVSSSISLSTLDLTSAVLSLPQGTGAGYATEGYVYWRTDTNRLFVGDGTATRAMAFADEILAPATVTLTAAQLYGTRVNNYGQTAIATITLPTVAEGMDTVFVFGTATSATYSVQATGANAMYYSGATSAGVRIAAPAVGNFFVLYSFKTGASAWSWILKDGQGTIATF